MLVPKIFQYFRVSGVARFGFLTCGKSHFLKQNHPQLLRRTDVELVSRHKIDLLLYARHFLGKRFPETLYTFFVNFYTVMLHARQYFGKRQLYLVQKPCHSLFFYFRKHYRSKACESGYFRKFPQIVICRHAVLRAHSLNGILRRIGVQDVPQNICVRNNIFQFPAVFKAESVNRLRACCDFFAAGGKKIKLRFRVGNGVQLVPV